MVCVSNLDESKKAEELYYANQNFYFMASEVDDVPLGSYPTETTLDSTQFSEFDLWGDQYPWDDVVSATPSSDIFSPPPSTSQDYYMFSDVTPSTPPFQYQISAPFSSLFQNSSNEQFVTQNSSIQKDNAQNDNLLDIVCNTNSSPFQSSPSNIRSINGLNQQLSPQLSTNDINQLSPQLSSIVVKQERSPPIDPSTSPWKTEYSPKSTNTLPAVGFATSITNSSLYHNNFPKLNSFSNPTIFSSQNENGRSNHLNNSSSLNSISHITQRDHPFYRTQYSNQLCRCERVSGRKWRVFLSNGDTLEKREQALYEDIRADQTLSCILFRTSHPHWQDYYEDGNGNGCIYLLKNQSSGRKPPKFERYDTWKCHTLTSTTKGIKRWRYNIPGETYVCKVLEWEDESDRVPITVYHFYIKN